MWNVKVPQQFVNVAFRSIGSSAHEFAVTSPGVYSQGVGDRPTRDRPVHTPSPSQQTSIVSDANPPFAHGQLGPNSVRDPPQHFPVMWFIRIVPAPSVAKMVDGVCVGHAQLSGEEDELLFADPVSDGMAHLSRRIQRSFASKSARVLSGKRTPRKPLRIARKLNASRTSGPSCGNPIPSFTRM